MEFSFTLDIDDIEDGVVATLVGRRATRTPRRRPSRTRDRITGFVSGAFILALIFVIAYRVPYMAAIFGLVVVLIGWALSFTRRHRRRPVTTRVLAERVLERLSAEGLTRTVRIDENGVSTTIADGSMSQGWPDVIWVVETKRCFVLITRWTAGNRPQRWRQRRLARRTQNQVTNVVPKRAMLQQQKAELRAVIETGLRRPILDIRR